MTFFNQCFQKNSFRLSPPLCFNSAQAFFFFASRNILAFILSMLKDYLKKKELTYLFIDFDGVLNTTSYAKLLRKEGIDHYDEFGAMWL